MDLSRISKISPNLNLRGSDFHIDDPGGVEDPCVDDGEHIILECQKCHVPLADIWLTRPDDILSTKAKAQCCYCDGESDEVEIEGRFHLGCTEKSGVSDIECEEQGHTGNIMISQTINIITGKI